MWIHWKRYGAKTAFPEKPAQRQVLWRQQRNAILRRKKAASTVLLTGPTCITAQEAPGTILITEDKTGYRGCYA